MRVEELSDNCHVSRIHAAVQEVRHRRAGQTQRPPTDLQRTSLEACCVVAYGTHIVNPRASRPRDARLAPPAPPPPGDDVVGVGDAPRVGHQPVELLRERLVAHTRRAVAVQRDAVVQLGGGPAGDGRAGGGGTVRMWQRRHSGARASNEVRVQWKAVGAPVCAGDGTSTFLLRCGTHAPIPTHGSWHVLLEALHPVPVRCRHSLPHGQLVRREGGQRAAQRVPRHQHAPRPAGACGAHRAARAQRLHSTELQHGTDTEVR